MELHAHLRSDASQLRAQWLVEFEHSPMRFRRDLVAADYETSIAGLIEAIAVAVSTSLEHLQPGAAAVRDLERECAFMGARFASDGATGYDAAAALAALARVLGTYLVEGAALEPTTLATKIDRLFDWLTVVTLDAFATAQVDACEERFADHLEHGTPVVTLLPKVPAVFFVGAPSASLIEGLLARALLLVVGTGAPSLILDVDGLAEAADHCFAAALDAFATQARVRNLHVIVSGPRKLVQQRAGATAGSTQVSVACCESVEAAVAVAIAHAGLRLFR